MSTGKKILSILEQQCRKIEVSCVDNAVLIAEYQPLVPTLKRTITKDHFQEYVFKEPPHQTTDQEGVVIR